MRFLNNSVGLRESTEKAKSHTGDGTDPHQFHFHASKDGSGRSKQYNDVWYRHILKPIASKWATLSYRDSFRSRVLNPSGIPVTQFNPDIHAAFKVAFRHYSPLIGMIFTYNNFVDNTYRYGDSIADDEPAVGLIRQMFHALPGSEIQPTHLGSMAGAHLSASLVGMILEQWEAFKQKHSPSASSPNTTEMQQKLADDLVEMIGQHTDYKRGQFQLLEDVRKAEHDLSELRIRDENSQRIRQEIKQIEGDIIKRNKHQIKRIAKKIEVSEGDVRRELQQQIKILETDIEKAEDDVSRLRAVIVISSDFKVARKGLRRAQDAVASEEFSRVRLANSLAACFMSYEGCHDGHLLPVFTTTAILQAYLWRKYDNMKCLEEYLVSMDRLGALQVTLKSVLDLVNETAESADAKEKAHVNAHNARRWQARDYAAAALVAMDKSSISQRPAIIPFSYIYWAAYSEFPDCGETALRNLLNQMLYNPNRGNFDHHLLTELKTQYYPNMNEKLIDFYRKHPDPQGATDYGTAKDWIVTVSQLNQGNQGERIRYRREMQETNIASPLSNLLRVLNALLGIKNLSSDSLPALTQAINKLRDSTLEIDTSRIQHDGFGVLSLTAGKTRFELQSYKPVHFGFVQAETLQADNSWRKDFPIVQRLLRLTSTRKAISSPDHPAHFEQLAFASLFVPYQMQRNKVERFFKGFPTHVFLLFADMNSPLQAQVVIRWARQQHEYSQLSRLIGSIENCKEPIFMPKSKSDNSHSSSGLGKSDGAEPRAE